MNPTDILLSIAIVGIYTMIYVYLKSQFKNDKIRLKLFVSGFVCATIITGILYYLIKFIASLIGMQKLSLASLALPFSKIDFATLVIAG